MKRVQSNRRARSADRLPDPLPHATNIDMDEVRFRIVADAAYLHCKSSLVKLVQRASRQGNVDGFPLHMQALRSHAGIHASELRVRFRRAVSADQLETTTRFEPGADFVDCIKQFGWNRIDVIRHEIPQRLVDRRERISDVLAFDPIVHRFQVFTRVDAVEREGSGVERLATDEGWRGQGACG